MRERERIFTRLRQQIHSTAMFSTLHRLQFTVNAFLSRGLPVSTGPGTGRATICESEKQAKCYSPEVTLLSADVIKQKSQNCDRFWRIPGSLCVASLSLATPEGLTPNMHLLRVWLTGWLTWVHDRPQFFLAIPHLAKKPCIWIKQDIEVWILSFSRR